MISLIESIALGIALPLALWLLNKFMPYKLPAEAHPLTLELLRDKYARWDWLTMALVFVFVPLLGYVCYDALAALAAHQVKQFQGEPFVLKPFWMVWAIPAGFLGLMAANIPVSWILQRLLKQRFAEYLLYQNLNYGFDSQRLGKKLFTIIGLLCAVYLAFTLDFYVVFGRSEIIVNDLPSFSETRHAYADIDSIQVKRFPAYRNPNRTQTVFTIDFKDGRQWNSAWSPIDAGDPRVLEIIAFISEKNPEAVVNASP